MNTTYFYTSPICVEYTSWEHNSIHSIISHVKNGPGQVTNPLHRRIQKNVCKYFPFNEVELKSWFLNRNGKGEGRKRNSAGQTPSSTSSAQGSRLVSPAVGKSRWWQVSLIWRAENGRSPLWSSSQRHNPSLIMRNTSNTHGRADSTQSICPVLLETVRALQTKDSQRNGCTKLRRHGSCMERASQNEGTLGKI